MLELTSRERLLRTLKGQDVDRIPVSPHINDNFVRYFKKSHDVDIARDTVELNKYFGFDMMHRYGIYGIYGGRHIAVNSDNWNVTQYTEKNGDEEIFVTLIKTPEREMVQRDAYRWITPYLRVHGNNEWFIKDEEDLEQFIKYEPKFTKSLAFQEQIRTFELTGQYGITAPWVHSAFNAAAIFRKLDDLLVDMIASPGFYDALMNFVVDRQIDLISHMLNEGVDVLSYSANIASGTMVGPRLFKDHVFKYEKRLIDFVQGQGVPVLYHNCGDAKGMYDIYNELGIMAYESMTEPPYADNDLWEVVSKMDKNIVLIGNIDQIDFLKKSTPEEIREKTKELVSIAKERGRFIIGVSDFLEEDTPYENIFAFANTVREYGAVGY